MATVKVLPEFSEISRRRSSMLEKEEEGEGEVLEEEAVPVDDTVTYHVYTESATSSSSYQNIQILAEVSARVAEGEVRAVHIWEQDNVRHLQEALNGQPDMNAETELRILPMGPVIRSSMDRRLISAGGVTEDLEFGDLLQVHHLPQDLSTTSAVGVQRTVIAQKSKLKKTGGERRRRRGDGDDDDGCKYCHVCGGEAGKHSYYGGQVCPSCRAFFRRSVTSGANKSYYCVKSGNCDVNCKTRKQCQFCRYKLCEEAGMKTSWVITDSERKRSSGEGKQKRRSTTDADDVDLVDGEQAAAGCITKAELTLIGELVDISDYWETSKVNDMDTSLIREIIRMVAFSATLSEEGLNQLATTMKLRAKKVALRLREMQQLSEEDREEILSKNIPILIKLKISTFFNPDLTWGKQLSGLLGSGEVEKLDRKLRTLKVEGLDNKRLKYSQFFTSPFLQTAESEQEFCKLLYNIGSWPEDEKEYILMSILLLFSPDLLVLQDRARVEQIQTSIAEILHNYLSYRHGRERGRSKFASAMFLVSRCRQLHDILTRNRIHLSG